jgi:hypothetical protein
MGRRSRGMPYEGIGADYPLGADSAASAAGRIVALSLLLAAVVYACIAGSLGLAAWANSVFGLTASYGITLTRTGANVAVAGSVANVLNTYSFSNPLQNSIELIVTGNLTYGTGTNFYSFGLASGSNGAGYNSTDGTYRFPATGRYIACVNAVYYKGSSNLRPDYMGLDIQSAAATTGSAYIANGAQGAAYPVATTGAVYGDFVYSGCAVFTVCPTCITNPGSYFRLNLALLTSEAQGAPPNNVDTTLATISIAQVV